MTKEEKVKKIITAVTDGLKSDLCKDGYPESQINELNTLLIASLYEVINEPDELTSSLRELLLLQENKQIESLQLQLAESQKRENVMAKIADRAQDINEELLAKCNKAELDKQELLDLISRLNDYFFCEKTLDEWEYEDLMNSTHKAIITHA